MALDKTVKTRKTVTVRMFGYVFFVQFTTAHPLMTEAFTVGRKKRFQDCITGIVNDRLGRQVEQLTQTGVIQTEDFIKIHMQAVKDL